MKVTNFTGNWEFFEFRMRNFQVIVFVWTETYIEIFKSALVYL